MAAVDAVVYAAAPFESIAMALGRGLLAHMAHGRKLAGWPDVASDAQPLAPDGAAALPDIADVADDPDQSAAEESAAEPDPYW